jgi:hypothetical protein
MNSIFTILCALLVGAVFSHSVNAHESTTDSVEPIILGDVFQFSFSSGHVTRQLCASAQQVEVILDDISNMTPRRAHHFLFHDAYMQLNREGKQKLKRGYSAQAIDIIEENCKGLRFTKFAVADVVKEIDVRGARVSIIAVYLSYKSDGPDGSLYYTWLVRTKVLEPTYPVVMQRILKSDYLTIGRPARVPKGMLAFSSLGLVQEIFSSASKQPRFVGRRVLQHPTKSFMLYEVNIRFKDEQRKGWVQSTGSDADVVFSEFVESKQIHGLNVSILAFEIPSAPSGDPYRLYTWVVDAEVFDSNNKRRTSVQ